MTIKQTLMICLTHGMWQLYGTLSAIYPQRNLYIVGLFIGLATYFTYKKILEIE